jgi:hypothetical protein
LDQGRFGAEGTDEFLEVGMGTDAAEVCASIHEAIAKDDVELFIPVMAALAETLKRIDMTFPEGDIDLLFCFEAGAVPVAGEEVFAREHATDFGMGEVASLKGTVSHDVQERLEGRAGKIDGAVFEVMLSDALMGGDDVIHAVDEDGEILEFRPEHFGSEDDMGMIEDTPEVMDDKFVGNAVAKAAGQDAPAFVIEVIAFFQVAVFDHVGRVSLGIIHAGPEFWNEHADVVIDASFWADVTGGGDEALVTGEKV